MHPRDQATMRLFAARGLETLHDAARMAAPWTKPERAVKKCRVTAMPRSASVAWECLGSTLAAPTKQGKQIRFCFLTGLFGDQFLVCSRR
jgi:hypothetical protein